MKMWFILNKVVIAINVKYVTKFRFPFLYFSRPKYLIPALWFSIVNPFSKDNLSSSKAQFKLIGLITFPFQLFFCKK